MPKKTAVFSEEAGRRIKSVVETVESSPTSSPGTPRPPHAPFPPDLIALTTSSISPRGGTTSAPVWGSGTVQAYRNRGGADVLADVLPVKNSQAVTIPSGVIVQCKFINGFYFVDVAPC